LTVSRFRAFIAVADFGSFTKAAAMMNYTQPAVSHLITSLENELGIELFIRTKNGAKLTPEAEVILPHIRELIKNEDHVYDISHEISGINEGRMNIGTFTSVALKWIPDLLADYYALYPGVEIQIKNGNYTQIERYLRNCTTILAFTPRKNNPEFDYIFLKNDSYVAVLPANHPLADRKLLRPQDLADENVILPAEGNDYDLANILKMMGKVPRILYDMNDDMAAVGMVRAGHGISFLPALLLEDYPVEGIAKVPIEGITREICLAHLKDGYLGPRSKGFIDLCLSKYGQKAE